MDQRPVVAQLAVSSLSEQRRGSRGSGANDRAALQAVLIYLSSEDRYEEIHVTAWTKIILPSGNKYRRVAPSEFANGPRQWCGWLNFVIGRK